MTCPYCGESARFQRWRDKSVTTLLGEIRVDRAYYHCGHCHSGHIPRDGQLRLGSGDLSLGAARVAALTGVLASFAEAAKKTLVELCGMHISESTVERITRSR